MTHSLSFHGSEQCEFADVTYSVLDCVNSHCECVMPCWGSQGPTLGVVAHWSNASHQMLAETGTKHAPIPPHRLRRHHSNWRKELGPPHHSTHALASIVKCLKSSTSVFFSAEITERALMWNLPPFFLFYFFALLPLAPPPHGYSSKCEALIKPLPLFFKSLAPS